MIGRKNVCSISHSCTTAVSRNLSVISYRDYTYNMYDSISFEKTSYYGGKFTLIKFRFIGMKEIIESKIVIIRGNRRRFSIDDCDCVMFQST